MNDRVRSLDEQYLHGRGRRWFLRNAVLGGAWGEFLDELAAVPDGSVVVDLGAGEATLRAKLPRARYLAVDRGIGHGGWDYSALDVVADAHAVPLADACADLVVCKQVLEHLTDPSRCVREIRRVLRPGGRVLLSTNQQWPQHQQPYDFFRFTSFGLRHLFEQAGLRVERLEPMGGVFSVALYQFSQPLAPHLWARGDRGRAIAAAILKPFGYLM